MSMWRSEARGLTSRMALAATSTAPDAPRTRYRLRAFERGDGFAWEAWAGDACINRGAARTLLVAQAYADAVAAGHPGVIGRRRRTARPPPPPVDTPVNLWEVFKLLFVAGSMLSATYWTWAFVALDGAVRPMLLSLAVLVLVGVYSSRGSLWGAPQR